MARTSTTWTKGKSGNPGGRPAVVKEVKEAARAYTTEAVDTLAAIMRDQDAPPSARVSAANSLLDRGYGRPAQTLEHTGKDGEAMEVRQTSAVEDILRRLSDIKARQQAANVA